MHPLRAAREAAALSQAALASRAGVSRQLVGAVEVGRHQPRVDAAIALARALGADVATLFAPPDAPVDVRTGRTPASGAPVRVGRVRDRVVTAPARTVDDGFDAADAVVGGDGMLQRLSDLRPGLVVAGCEPGLHLLERLLRQSGSAAVGVTLPSSAAAGALAAGRVHAAVVHGPEDDGPQPPDGVARLHLARWSVGLAAPLDAPRGWAEGVLGGRRPAVVRDPGAGVQRALERASAAVGGTVLVGGHAETHVAAVRTALATGVAGVTIEPAALAVGAAFHTLEVHAAQLWVPRDLLEDPAVAEALDVLAGRGFLARLERVGGYDLAGTGTWAA